jgi:hypothetical protein
MAHTGEESNLSGFRNDSRCPSVPDAYLGMSDVQVAVRLWWEPRQHLPPSLLEMLRQPLFRVCGPPYPPVTIPDLRVHLRIWTDNELVETFEKFKGTEFIPDKLQAGG